MQCPRCLTENPTPAKFCTQCGSSLAGACRQCGGELPARARFCPECGRAADGAAAPDPLSYTPRHVAEHILTLRSAIEGERKRVSVLFADVKGSMELAEQLDPEEWHAVMDRFFAILSAGVHRFGGTVNQYTGDGIMALFGAPIAYEDHAERACSAALALADQLRSYAQELKRERGLGFSVRMGINSGSVVVGSIGDDLRMDYTAQGHTVGLAARLQTLAEPGRAYLSEETAQLVAGRFELEDLGAFRIKGVQAPVRVHALVGVGPLGTRFDVSRQRGLSRFVGRDAEIAELERALGEARDGRGQIVGVAGEAGVGKSRLCHEFAERCRTSGAVVAGGHALAYGDVLPLLPVRQLLRASFGLADQDAPEAARNKIAGALLLLDEGLKDVLPLLFDLLGVPDAERPVAPLDADQRQRRIADVAARLLGRRAEKRPVVVLLEDLHWVDPSSEVFLRHFAPAVEDARILLLVNFRLHYEPGWARGRRYRQVVLKPFAPGTTSELLGEILGPDPSLGSLIERIAERSGGNPFFVEEIVRALIQRGSLCGLPRAYRWEGNADDLGIPATVESMIAARIDRLSDGQKAVLQAAAVLGKRFALPLLQAVVRAAGVADARNSADSPDSPGSPDSELVAALGALEEGGFVVAESLYPVAEYAFQHPLTQQVAYGAQLRERRARLHAAVAGALFDPAARDVGDGTDGEDGAALIAHHWECAGRLWEAAVWSRRAADRAAGSDSPEALRRLRKTVELLERVPPSEESSSLGVEARTSMLRVGPLAGLRPEQAQELLAAARPLAESLADRNLLAELLSTYGYYRMMAGELGPARDYAEESFVVADQAGDEALQLLLRMDRAQAGLWAGNLRETLQAVEESLELLRHGSGSRAINVGLGVEPFVLAWHGVCRTLLGEVGAGVAELDAVIELAHSQGAPEGICVVHTLRSLVAQIEQDAASALAHALTACEVAERLGAVFLQVQARSTLAAAWILDGRTEEGTQLLERLLGAGRTEDALVPYEDMLLAYLAQGRSALGDTEGALAAASEGVAMARRRGARLAECIAQIALARVHAMRGSGEEEAALACALALIEETGARCFTPRVWMARGEAARRRGDAPACDAAYAEAARLAREAGMDKLAAAMDAETGKGGAT